jgi:hypothetical protein
MDAFKALEELSKLGKVEGNVNVGDAIKLILGTLDTEQESDVFAKCADLTGNAYFYQLKLGTIKYSLKGIYADDGKTVVRLDDYLSIEKADERKKAREVTLARIDEIIGKWDENVISYLYSEWNKLAKKSEDDLKEKGISQDLTEIKPEPKK